jgi:hypothetical protein
MLQHAQLCTNHKLPYYCHHRQPSKRSSCTTKPINSFRSVLCVACIRYVLVRSCTHTQPGRPCLRQASLHKSESHVSCCDGKDLGFTSQEREPHKALPQVMPDKVTADTGSASKLRGSCLCSEFQQYSVTGWHSMACVHAALKTRVAGMLGVSSAHKCAPQPQNRTSKHKNAAKQSHRAK